MDAEDPFLLPNTTSHELKLDRLESNLSELQEKIRDLKRSLAEEKLSYLMTTSFADAIPDPRKQKAIDMNQVQEEIMEQLTTATESRYLQQVLSGFRLSGWTTFNFQQDYIGFRLDTFYDRRYYEPYYLFLLKDDPSTINRHTLPPFIPVTRIEETFLPTRIDSMLRIIQDFLLAFVSRREQFKALQKYIDKKKLKKVKIDILGAAQLSIAILQPLDDGLRCYIDIQYKIFTSICPSDVTVKILDQQHNPQQLDQTVTIADAFKSKRLLQAYKSLF